MRIGNIEFPYIDLCEVEARQEIKVIGIKTSMKYDAFIICMNALNGDVFAVYESALVEKVIGSVSCAIDRKVVDMYGL